MLPVVASLLMGFVSKTAAGDPNNAMDMLGSLTLAGGGGIVGAIKRLGEQGLRLTEPGAESSLKSDRNDLYCAGYRDGHY